MSSNNGKSEPPKFTRNELKVLDLLSDSGLHTREEVLASIGDSQSSLGDLHKCINRLRAKLPFDEDIVCQVKGRKHYYRYVLIPPPKVVYTPKSSQK